MKWILAVCLAFLIAFVLLATAVAQEIPQPEPIDPLFLTVTTIYDRYATVTAIFNTEMARLPVYPSATLDPIFLTVTAIYGAADIATALDTLPSPPATQTATAINVSQTREAALMTQAVAVITREYLAPTRTAIAVTRDPMILSRTPIPENCPLLEEHRDLPDLTYQLRERLRENGIETDIEFFVQAYSPARHCLETFVQTDIHVEIENASEDEIASTLVEVLSAFDALVDDRIYSQRPSTRLTITWVLTRASDYRYGLMVDTQYNNAIRAFREGLRDEQLIRALGDLVPSVAA